MNFDSSPTLRFERVPIVGRLYAKNAQRFPPNVRYGDIVKGLPLPHGSCKGVYCSHVLEHLAFADLEIALRNTYSLLQPCGIFRLVLPDLELLAKRYFVSSDEMASVRFMEDTCLGRKSRSRTLVGFLSDWLGGSAHLWMWDERSMARKLRECGFKSIRRATLGDCEDQKFREVEHADRFDGCLAMQCSK